MGQFEFPGLPIKSSLLQGFQFHCESWADFLKSYTLSLVIENVPMTAEEDEITLVMESDSLSPMKLGNWGEERHDESSNCVTKTGSEIV